MSPVSRTGSFSYSLLLHLAVCGAVVGYFHFRGAEKFAQPPEIMDLGLQEFDEPPPPEQKELKVHHSPTPPTPVEQKVKVDNTPKEMQDEHSDVAGTQKEAPKASTNIGSNNNGTAEATPYYKIKPKYPKEALAAGIEGWVLLKLDITEKGEVENVRVVDGEQRNMFQSEARRAVQQYRYRPFVDPTGNPIRKPDHLVRVDFKLVESTNL